MWKRIWKLNVSSAFSKMVTWKTLVAEFRDSLENLTMGEHRQYFQKRFISGPIPSWWDIVEQKHKVIIVEGAFCQEAS